MKRAFFTLLVVTVSTAFAGCRGPHGDGLTNWIRGSCARAPENCQSCDAGCDGQMTADVVRGEGPADSESYTAGYDMCNDGSCQIEEVGCGDDGCQYEEFSCGEPVRQVQYRAPPPPGPPTGAVAYPYYTNRGPRDFLDRNPRSIGP